MAAPPGCPGDASTTEGVGGTGRGGVGVGTGFCHKTGRNQVREGTYCEIELTPSLIDVIHRLKYKTNALLWANKTFTETRHVNL